MKIYPVIILLFCQFTLLSIHSSAQDTARVVLSSPGTSAAAPKHHSNYFSAAGVIVPGTFILYGSLKPAIKGIQQADDDIMASVKKKYPDFHTKADDYLMWAPSASIYLMDALHIKTKHSFTQHLLLDAGSVAVAGGAGFVMRKISKNIDVYNTQFTKFPSGHTTNAFRGAEIFHQELKDISPVLSYSGYLVATTVGVLRIYNKNHLLTEVLAGAGLGILSAKLTYLIFDTIKYRKKKN
jgi:membrane-associated phospholipid phosphatase